jgi:hypothetical protein
MRRSNRYDQLRLRSVRPDREDLARARTDFRVHLQNALQLLRHGACRERQDEAALAIGCVIHAAALLLLCVLFHSVEESVAFVLLRRVIESK